LSTFALHLSSVRRRRSSRALPAARAAWAPALAALLLGACGGGDPGTGSFIPQPRDFDQFKTWPAFDLGADQDDGVTVAGTRRAYLNHVPPHGSTEFPVGTIIVKTIGEETAAPGQTFAMAKRDAPFNVRGAVGWEWFEVEEVPDSLPKLNWRGITPPMGETYGGIDGGACNTCHALGSANDFVPSVELSLTQF